MSRIGKKPVTVPQGVTLDLKGSEVAVKGPKGELRRTLHPEMQLALADGTFTVARPSEEPRHKALHGLTRTLVRALGRHRAIEVLLGERQLSAGEARDLGLVSAVVPAAKLDEAARDLAQRLANGPTRAIGMTKRLVNAAEDAILTDALASEAALQELAGRSEDHAEGVAAFGEKREPRFSGR